MNIISSYTQEFKKVFQFRWVVYAFVTYTMKMRYKRSILGFSWSILGPFFNYMIIGIVLSKIARYEDPSFLNHLLLGSLIFNFFAACCSQGLGSFIGNEHYIKKIYIPKMVYPFSNVLMESANFCFSMLAILVLLLILKKLEPSALQLFFPILFLPLLIFCLGTAMMLGVLAVYFRDVLHIVPILLQALFFCTPIVYPEKLVPPDMHWLLVINPINIFLEVIRTPLQTGRLPNLHLLALAYVIALLSLSLGIATVRRFDSQIVFKL